MGLLPWFPLEMSPFGLMVWYYKLILLLDQCQGVVLISNKIFQLFFGLQIFIQSFNHAK